jgi:hypothetical protein
VAKSCPTANQTPVVQPVAGHCNDRAIPCVISRIGRAMAQVVSRRPLTAQARVCAWVSPCGIDRQSGTGQVFLKVLQFFPVSAISPWFSMLLYLGDEQYVRLWSQFTDSLIASIKTSEIFMRPCFVVARKEPLVSAWLLASALCCSYLRYFIANSL